MAFCTKCGRQIGDDEKFCPGCGSPVLSADASNQANQGNSANQESFTDKVQNLNNTADTTADFDPSDIASNKGISVLSYIGLLFLIPLFCTNNSKYARYHVNQGLVLFLTGVAYGVVQGVLTLILGVIFPFSFFTGRSVVYVILTTILSLVWLAFTALMIIGIVNAATGKAKELPIIGKIKILD